MTVSKSMGDLIEHDPYKHTATERHVGSERPILVHGSEGKAPGHEKYQNNKIRDEDHGCVNAL